MDHEVEHDRDVDPARAEWRKPVRLDKDRFVEVWLTCAQNGVEALDMPDLHMATGVPSSVQNAIGGFQRRRHRFLHHHVHAGAQCGARDLFVSRGGYRNDERVCGRNQRVERCVRIEAELGADLRATLRIGVVYTDARRAIDIA